MIEEEDEHQRIGKENLIFPTEPKKKRGLHSCQ